MSIQYSVHNITKGVTVTVNRGETKNITLNVGDNFQIYGNGWAGYTTTVDAQSYLSGAWQTIGSFPVAVNGTFISGVMPVLSDVGSSQPTRISEPPLPPGQPGPLLTSGIINLVSGGGGGGGKTKSFAILQSFDLIDPPTYQSVNKEVTLAAWDASKTTVTKATLSVRASATDTSRELSIWTNESPTGVLSWAAGQANQEHSIDFDVTAYIISGSENTFRFNYYVTFGLNLAYSHCYTSAILTLEYTGDDPVVKPKPPPFTLEWWQWGLIGGGVLVLVIVSRPGGGSTIINLGRDVYREVRGKKEEE